MIDARDRDLLRSAGREVRKGRKAIKDTFYLERKTFVSVDPFTNEPVYTTVEEMVCPVIQTLKGDEHEIVAGMKIAAGDLICTFDYNKAIPTAEPTIVGTFCYTRVKYLNVYYSILRVWPKGLGSFPNRKILFATKVK